MRLKNNFNNIYFLFAKKIVKKPLLLQVYKNFIVENLIRLILNCISNIEDYIDFEFYSIKKKILFFVNIQINFQLDLHQMTI